MKICNRTNKPRTFHEFVYRGVGWSSDTLPYCPKCGMSPYDEDYEDCHSTVIINEGIKE
jgi:hypothetical protein